MEAVTEEKAPSLHIGDVFFNGAVRVIRSDVEGKHAHIALEEDEKKMPADELIALVSAFEKISNQGRLSIEGLALLADAAAKAIASSTTAPESTPVPPEGKDTAPPPDAPRRPREGR